MHAQDDGDEESFNFWWQLLGRVLMQLSGTPQPLMPWLTDAYAPGGVRGAVVIHTEGPVCSVRFALCCWEPQRSCGSFGAGSMSVPVGHVPVSSHMANAPRGSRSAAPTFQE